MTYVRRELQARYAEMLDEAKALAKRDERRRFRTGLRRRLTVREHLRFERLVRRIESHREQIAQMDTAEELIRSFRSEEERGT